MTFPERLAAAVTTTGTPLCVGIDPWPERLPGRSALGPNPDRAGLSEAARDFGLAVVQACAGRVAAVKPQFAFFESLGWAGMRALHEVCTAARAAGLLVVGDAKRGDIGSTAEAYASAILGVDAPFPCDALTASPYLGPESLVPFVQAAHARDCGIFVLLRTSNPNSAVWQAPIAGEIATWVETQNRKPGASGLGSVGVVIGATNRDEMKHWRQRMPRTWFLVPGFGAQGASAADARLALREDGLGALIASARGATFPEVPSATYDRDPAGWMQKRIDAVKRSLRAH